MTNFRDKEHTSGTVKFFTQFIPLLQSLNNYAIALYNRPTNCVACRIVRPI